MFSSIRVAVENASTDADAALAQASTLSEAEHARSRCSPRRDAPVEAYWGGYGAVVAEIATRASDARSRPASGRRPCARRPAVHVYSSAGAPFDLR